MAESTEPSGGKKAKRISGKASARQTVMKVKSTIHLTTEASQRLDIHCTMMGFDRSAMVEKLINEHLRRFIVSDRGGDVAVEGGSAA